MKIAEKVSKEITAYLKHMLSLDASDGCLAVCAFMVLAYMEQCYTPEELNELKTFARSIPLLRNLN